MPDKFSRYLLIAILIGVIVVIFFLYKNKKDTSAQSDLLLAMAEKLGTVKHIEEEETKDETTKQEPREETEEDGFEIVRIAEKIYSENALTKKEKDFQAIFPDQIADEVEYCKNFYPLVEKFVSGEKEFTDEEKEFYESNKEAVVAEVEIKNSEFKIQNSKETTPSSILHLPSTIQTDLSKATPPLSTDERLKLVRSFFEDGIPKSVTILAELYAQARGAQPSKGNMHQFLGRMEEAGNLLSQKLLINSRNQVFYGLPEWFDEKKKLKKEFKQKLI